MRLVQVLIAIGWLAVIGCSSIPSANPDTGETRDARQRSIDIVPHYLHLGFCGCGRFPEVFQYGAVSLDGVNPGPAIPNDLLVWMSGRSMVADIDELGLARAIGPGIAAINVELRSDHSVRAQGVLEVTEANCICSLQLRPEILSLAVGASVQLQLTAVNGDGQVSDYSQQVAWESSTPATVQVEPGGRISGLSVGTAEIRGRIDMLSSNPCLVTVTPR